MVEARTDAAAGGGDSGGVDEGGGFDAEGGGEVFEGGLEAFGGPGLEAGEAVAEDVEAFEGSVGAEGFSTLAWS